MIAGLGPYPEMKDSGIPWLGSVPVHWSLRRGKSLFQAVDIRSQSGAEDLLTVSSKHGVVPRSSASVTMFQAESYVGHKLCWPGDLVINSLWAWGGGLGVTRRHGIVSTAYGVYRLRSEFAGNSGFFHELVRSQPFQWELQVRSKGIWISRLQLTDEAFLTAPFPVPPREECEAIVRFLNHADRRIRRSIRAKQELIALLNEQKQGVIQLAVTRGSNPNVRLKPTGVEWLGHVPEHWEVLPLKRRWTVTDCKHVTVPFVEDGIPVASVREVQTFDLSLENAMRTTPEWYQMLIEGGRQPRCGDLIYCRNTSVGAAAVVTTKEQFAMGQDVCLIRSRSQNQRYLNYFLQSPAMERQLASLLVGSTFDRINVADIKNLIITVPPGSEQGTIADQLDRELREADAASANARQQIELIREYRTRLTADVVTGKLDIREAAARLPDEADEPELLDDMDVEEAEESDIEAAKEPIEA